MDSQKHMVINVDGGVEITDLTEAELKALDKMPIFTVLPFRNGLSVMVSQTEDGKRGLWDISASMTKKEVVPEMPSDFEPSKGLPKRGQMVRVWRDGKVVQAVVASSADGVAYDASYQSISEGDWAPMSALMPVPKKLVAEGELKFDRQDGGMAMMAGLSPQFSGEVPDYPFGELWFTVHSYASEMLSRDDRGAMNLWANQLNGRRVRIVMEVLD
jgi:hypothetical protein